jgi:hypothetical protein
MTQVTAQSVTGTPGRRHSFSPKTEAAVPKGAGPFTELSATATPGARHTFVAKDPSLPPTKGEGPFTALSVMGTPGGLRTFVAKGAVVIIPPVKGDRPVSGSSGTNVGDILMAQHRKRLLREDDEILLLLMAAMEVLH